MFIGSGTVTMNGGVLEQSSARDGAAIYIKGGTGTFQQGVIIRDNTATGWGGVSYSTSGVLTFDTCTFVGNQATLGAPKFATKIVIPFLPPEVTVTNCVGADQTDVVGAP